MTDPSTLGIDEFDRVLFVSDPSDGDKFIVLRNDQDAEGQRRFIYYVSTLDWNCYEEPPKVIRL